MTVPDSMIMWRAYGVALLVLCVLDGVWLGVLMKGFYREHLAPIARMKDGMLDPIWPVAVLVYPVIALGLTVFVLRPATTAGQAALLGALFGFVAYAIYDLTNHATLREWRTIVTVVDVAWGTVSCATTSWIAHWATRS